MIEISKELNDITHRLATECESEHGFEPKLAKESTEESVVVVSNEKGEVRSQEATFWDLFRYFQRGEFQLAVFAIFLSTAQGLIFPLMTAGGIPIFKMLFQKTNGPTSASSVAKDCFWSLAYLAVGLFTTTVISCMIWNVLSVRLTTRLKNKYYQQLMMKRTEWFDGRDAESISAQFCHHVVSISVVFSYKMHFFFFFYSQLFAGILLAFYWSPTFTLILVLVFPAVLLSLNLFLKSNQRCETEMTNWKNKAVVVLEQALKYYKGVKALNGEEHELRNFTALSSNAETELRKSLTKTSLFSGLFFGFLQLVFQLILGTGFYLVYYQYSNPFNGQPLTIEDLLFVVLAALPGFASIAQIEPIQKALERGKEAILEISSILDKTEAEPKLSDVKLPIRGRIEFRNVTFAYPSNPTVDVLKNISFVIEPGQKVGFVGSSGSGKTTISQLLERFYEPTSGQILVDNINIKDYDIDYLRQNIGLLSQHPVLFSLTIKENLTLGFKDWADADILGVLEKMEMKDFIFQMPKGLETELSHGGASLSTGQKQKLSIARLLLRDPKIMLFDEATGILDKNEEKELQATINEISKGKTTVHIAHKIETIRGSDVIMVMSAGQIIENGTHEELMKIEGGAYQRLIELQSINERQQQEAGDEDHLSADRALSLKEMEVMSAKYSSMYRTEEDQRAIISEQMATHILGHKITWATIIFSVMMSLITITFNYSCAKIIFCYTTLMARSDGNIDFLQRHYASIEALRDEAYFYIELLAALSVVTMFVFGSASGWLNYLCEDFLHRLRTYFCRKMLYMDAVFYDRPENQPNKISHLLNSQSADIREMFVNGMGRLVRLIFEMIMCYAVCFYFSYPLALTSIVLSFFIVLFKYAESEVMNVLDDENNKINVTLLNESINNTRFIKSVGCQEDLLKKFAEEDVDTDLKKQSFPFYAAVIFGLSQIFCYFAIALVGMTGLRCVLVYNYSVRDILSAQVIVYICLTYLMTLNDNLLIVSRGLKGLRKLLEKADSQAKIEADPMEARAVGRAIVFRPKIKGKIEFRNVVFRHHGRGKNALNGVSFVIQPGQTMAVFGRSGAGKTTIVELLLRFYDVCKGEILIDDINIKSFNLSYLRSLFGSFLQVPAIFQGSVRYNIMYNARITEEGLTKVMKKAQLREFLDNEGQELDRQLRANGDNLSGGQKQRINLARALTKPAAIYLYDEATSALDKANETEIMNELAGVSKGRTCMLLSTRATFMREADNILVIEGGNVVERGNFNGLIEKKGFFYRFSK